MTYDIKDISKLEEDSKELANHNQKVADDCASIKYIINLIESNWQNEAGTDLASVLKELENCVLTLNAITPTINQYVSTMNTLAAETRQIQKKTI